MRVFMKTLCLVSLIFITPVSSYSGEAVKLRPAISIYSDDQGSGLKNPEGVACGENSALIVADTGNGRLLRYTYQDKKVNGGSEIVVPELTYPIRVQKSSKGDLYALDGKKRRIARISSGGEFKGYLDPKGVPGPASVVPRSLIIDENDTVYVLDVFSGRVLLLDPDGNYQKQINFPKKYGFISDLAVDSRGNIFLIDSVGARVFSAPKGSNSFTPLSESLKEVIKFPTGISVDRAGIIYLVDQNGGGIAVLGQDGSFLSFQSNKGWNEGLLNYPSQMCVSEEGSVFIADRDNSRVQIFTTIK
jgi:sugar lactone lactonase YvrE